MTFEDLMALVDDNTLIQIRTQNWRMENPLSVGTIREVMDDSIMQHLIVRSITPKNAALMIWAEEK